MDKASKKAISVLKEQLEKADKLNSNNHQSWKSQTCYFVEKIFGKDSDHYKLISKFYFYHIDYPPPDIQIKSKIPEIKNIINSFIESVQHYGVKKKEWRHYLITANPRLAWIVGTVIAGGIFWLGSEYQAYKSNKAAYEKSRTKNDSTHTNDLPVKKDSILTDTTTLDTSKG